MLIEIKIKLANFTFFILNHSQYYVCLTMNAVARFSASAGVTGYILFARTEAA
jgi:hypothetical protein